MKRAITLAIAALCLISTASLAAPQHKAKAAPAAYVCSKCHMKFTAAKAKQDHYKDPMDGGVLVPAKPSAGKAAAPMNGMKK